MFLKIKLSSTKNVPSREINNQALHPSPLFFSSSAHPYSQNAMSKPSIIEYVRVCIMVLLGIVGVVREKAGGCLKVLYTLLLSFTLKKSCKKCVAGKKNGHCAFFATG